MIEAKDFCETSENRVTYRELTKTLHKLEVDEYGRCTDCARIQDRFIESKEDHVL